MSRKSKKTQAQVEAQEANGTDSVPATIVEGSQEDVFPSQAEGQSGTQETAPEQTVEKPAKPSRRPYLQLAEKLLTDGTHTRKELIAALREAHPEASKSGIETFVSDLPNPKYCFFKDRPVTKTAEGKLRFADKVVSPAETSPVEAGTTVGAPDEQPEQPAE